MLYTAHGFHFFDGAPPLNWLLYYPAERLAARWTDLLITINEEDYRRARAFPLRGAAAYVPGVGVDLETFGGPGARARAPAVREQLGVGPNEFLVVFPAELNENKNQGQMLRALRRLKDEGRRVICVFAGDGRKADEYRGLAAQLGLRAEAVFAGYRSDMAALYAAADAVALLSRREGLPLSVLEAMASERPVVGTGVRGIRDLVEDGTTGLIVGVDDVEATVRALRTLSNNPDMRRRLGEAGRRKAARYDVKEIRRRMAAIYDQYLR